MSTPGMRVDPAATRRVSEQSGVHIVGTTGFYSRDSWPKHFHDMSLDDMEAHMLDEVANGLEGTGVMPGHIKVAIEENFSEPEVNAVRAGVRVARQTGMSMTIHRGALLDAQASIGIADLLEREGMDPSRAVIAHNDGRFVEGNLQKLILNPDDWKLNLDPARTLLKRGFNLSLDCFGHYWDAEQLGMTAMNDWQRLAGLVVLIREGFVRQLVLGTDTFIKFLLRRFGGEGYCRLTSFVVPTLKTVDVSDEDIHALTVGNPARILAYG
jgi:phosphotriesterase-related protein